ncbi:WEB family protein At1g75720 [Mercurialis annua]|uniref:WEB family protein At1g75720 n=1 Tax=Mercurialis annua TaxID=3986 RepID=UPI00215F75DD|nr:WEB family protein At1g75720 [Mercurialis annua]
METLTNPSPSPNPSNDYSSLVDTSRPFRSVKEAVAIFGERIPIGDIYSPKPHFSPTTPSQNNNSWMFSSPASPITPINPTHKEYDHDHHHERNNTNTDMFFDSLKKLETELIETKMELKLLKERESETEIAVASLNAELHKNMAKLAEAEAATAAKKAAELRRKVSFDMEKKENLLFEEEKKREMMIRVERSPSLARILSFGEEKGYFNGKKEKKMKKMKPIVPLVGDLLFFRKKRSSEKTLNSPLFTSSYGVF